MGTFIKNIMLYDPAGVVTGFVEIRVQEDKTVLRLKHSLPDDGLLLSLIIDGVNKILQVTGMVNEYHLHQLIDLDYEVFACLVKQSGTELLALASGAINLNKLRRRAVREIDHAIKKICRVDEHGVGQCDHCPYRDYFFKQG